MNARTLPLPDDAVFSPEEAGSFIDMSRMLHYRLARLQKAMVDEDCCGLLLMGVHAHGIGMGDEWPAIPWPIDWETNSIDGELEENMVICIESFIGSEHGGEGVKLEQQVVVTRDGYELLSPFPWDDDLLSP